MAKQKQESMAGWQEQAKAYAQQRGFDEEQAVKITMKYRARFWKRFLKKHTVSFEVEL